MILTLPCRRCRFRVSVWIDRTRQELAPDGLSRGKAFRYWAEGGALVGLTGGATYGTVMGLVLGGGIGAPIGLIFGAVVGVGAGVVLGIVNGLVAVAFSTRCVLSRWGQSRELLAGIGAVVTSATVGFTLFVALVGGFNSVEPPEWWYLYVWGPLVVAVGLLGLLSQILVIGTPREQRHR